MFFSGVKGNTHLFAGRSGLIFSESSDLQWGHLLGLGVPGLVRAALIDLVLRDFHFFILIPFLRR